MIVDAQGVLHTQVFPDPSGQVMRERIAAAKATLGTRVAAFSKLRKISLNRLEQAILDHRAHLTDEMRFLAGLQRVRYVFYYPESKDIVLAGPAEGWVPDPAGRIVGIANGRPVVQIGRRGCGIARMFHAGGSSAPLIGCSIDPTQEGEATCSSTSVRLHLNGFPTAQQLQMIAEGIRTSLGNQVVTINGVPPNTRFAQVMVEADYRMKLIGIGLEKPPVRLVSFVDRARPSEANRLERWYLHARLPVRSRRATTSWQWNWSATA